MRPSTLLPSLFCLLLPRDTSSFTVQPTAFQERTVPHRFEQESSALSRNSCRGDVAAHASIVALPYRLEEDPREAAVRQARRRAAERASKQKQITKLFTPEQLADFLDSHPSDIVVLKIHAPWCRACKRLAPRFLQLAREEAFRDLPIVFAEFSAKDNMKFLNSMGIMSMPSIQFYIGSENMDTFSCGPSKTSLLRRKLVDFVNDNLSESIRGV